LPVACGQDQDEDGPVDAWQCRGHLFVFACYKSSQSLKKFTQSIRKTTMRNDAYRRAASSHFPDRRTRFVRLRWTTASILLTFRTRTCPCTGRVFQERTFSGTIRLATSRVILERSCSRSHQRASLTCAGLDSLRRPWRVATYRLCRELDQGGHESNVAGVLEKNSLNTPRIIIELNRLVLLLQSLANSRQYILCCCGVEETMVH
jgi:hypothetical protein